MRKGRSWLWLQATLALLISAGAGEAAAAPCARTIKADVVAIDQPIMVNRLGAHNVNAMMYALKRDVRTDSSSSKQLRPDKRPRPLVLRMAEGDCLRVTLTNWLTPNANPRNAGHVDGNGVPFNVVVDDQVADRHVGFHPQGLELVGGIDSDASFVGRNTTNSLANVGETKVYTFYAPEGGAGPSSSPATAPPSAATPRPATSPTCCSPRSTWRRKGRTSTAAR